MFRLAIFHSIFWICSLLILGYLNDIEQSRISYFQALNTLDSWSFWDFAPKTHKGDHTIKPHTVPHDIFHDNQVHNNQMYCFFFVFTLIFKEFVDDLFGYIIPLLVNGTRLYTKRVCSVCSLSFRFNIDDSFHEMRKL